MYRLAICDDEVVLCSQLEDIILLYGEVYQKHFKIEIFYSGDNLLNHLKIQEQYDFIILDICLKDTTGIEVGKRIRMLSTNYDIPIIYVSTFKDYALQLFKIRPFDFLVKPIKQDELFAVLDELIKKLDNKKNFYAYKSGGQHLRISYDNIMYFYSNDKKVFIVTSEQSTLEFGGKLNEVISVTNGYFLSIHKSFLINYDYVQKYTYENVEMCDGKKLNISQSRRKHIRNIILQKMKECSS